MIGIKLNSAGSWSFVSEVDRNLVIFGVDNSLSFHSDNYKNNFLILGEGPTYGINENFGLPEIKFCISFFKANTTFRFSLHLMLITYLFFTGKEIFKLKADKKILISQLSFA